MNCIFFISERSASFTGSTDCGTHSAHFFSEKSRNSLYFCELRDFCSGGGNRTARPSGYEPDELPTALPRDIGLQIYGHFLKLQIFISIFHHVHRISCFYSTFSRPCRHISFREQSGFYDRNEGLSNQVCRLIFSSQ